MKKKSDIKLDDEWLHIKQTMSMLCLAVAQIKISMDEGDHSVNKLTDSFIDLVRDVKEVLEDHKKELHHVDIDAMDKRIDFLSGDICTRVNDGVVAFQFYDRLTQRLAHVANGLNRVGQIVSDPDKREDVSAWIGLQDEIRGGYTMEAERMMFDSIIQGDTMEEALKKYKDSPLDMPEQGQIDLF